MKGIKVLKKTNKEGVYCSGGCGGSEYTEFEVGKTYKLNENPILCATGYHFFRYENYCFGFDFYDVGVENTVYVEIEALGDVVEDTFKCSTNEMKIIGLVDYSEFDLDEKNNSGACNSGACNSGYRNSGNHNSGNHNSGNHNSGVCNSGNHNSGNYNSGDYNSGACNSGDYNSGVCNSGNHNSGNYNSGDYNSGACNSGDYNSGNRNSGSWNLCDKQNGFFNINPPKYIDVFGRKCLRSAWDNCNKPDFIYFCLIENKTYKESFIASFENAKKETNWNEELELLENLPNFNWKIFEKISGISKEMAYE